jgi:L-malate glycosyltransferase
LKAIHQFVPTFEPGAVGAHTVELQRLIREDLGLESEIFAEFTKPPFQDRARPFREYGRRLPASDGDILLYQMAIGSKVADFLVQRHERLVVNHHNLTPAWFIEPWEPGVSYGTSWGEVQLRELASRTELAIPVSAFNERDLVGAGYARTAIAPVLVDYEAMAAEVDTGLEEQLCEKKQQGGAHWLFVGRISPHKCQHDIVKAFAVYHRIYDSHARLWLVGSSSSDGYVDALRRFIAGLGLEDAVTITGRTATSGLEAHYRTADVFVCLSDHEGFCTPLVEAMRHEIPVVAFASSAIPETLGSPPAGVLLSAKTPALVAAAVHRVLDDQAVRTGVIAKGRQRAEHFSLPTCRARYAEVLSALR